MKLWRNASIFMFYDFCEKFKLAAIFGGTIFFFDKLNQLLSRVTLWVKIFVKITLSSTVFRYKHFLCFAFGKKNSKIQNGRHFWRVKYLLKLGKASLHRYPVGQKFCRNPTSKFLLYKKMVSKSTHISLNIVLYMYVMSLYIRILYKLEIASRRSVSPDGT